jgi:hypothetical protein
MENARWKSDKMTVEAKLTGDRPAGIVAMDSLVVQAAQRAVSAVTIGGGGEGGTGTRATNGTSRLTPGTARRTRS